MRAASNVIEEAVLLARWCVWRDRAEAHFEEHGESYDPANPVPKFEEPEPPLTNRDYMDPDTGMTVLATGVIEQHEQLASLRAALTEACGLVETGLATDYGFNYDATIPVKARIAELRKLGTT